MLGEVQLKLSRTISSIGVVSTHSRSDELIKMKLDLLADVEYFVCAEEIGIKYIIIDIISIRYVVVAKKVRLHRFGKVMKNIKLSLQSPEVSIYCYTNSNI